jgi:hypothetical protein
LNFSDDVIERLLVAGHRAGEAGVPTFTALFTSDGAGPDSKNQSHSEQKSQHFWSMQICLLYQLRFEIEMIFF